MNTLIVGIDIAKATFTAATIWQGALSYHGQAANTAPACSDFAAHIAQLAQAVGAASIHLIIEPTGSYEAIWVAEAYRRQWLVTVVNPLAVRTWGQGRGRRTKTDRQDACLLAQFGAETDPPAQIPMPENAAELDSMLRRQMDLEKLLRSERNRQAQLAGQTQRSLTVAESLRRTIEALEHELAAINEAIRQLTSSDAAFCRQLKQLISVPGIGAKIAPHLLAIFYRFLARTSGQGTAKQLVAFLGLDPMPHESGTSVRKRPVISHKGDGVMRSKLYLGALGGVHGKNHLAEVYRSLLAHNKAKKLALVACARKMLVWAWAVFTKDTTFDSSLFDKMPLPA